MKTRTRRLASWRRSLSALTVIAIVALLSSCAHFNPPEPEPKREAPVAEKKPSKLAEPPPPSSLYAWYGTEGYVSNIEVSINEQKARFYSGDKEVGWTTVASGVRSYPTPTGSFAVIEKVKHKKSNLYGKIYNKDGKLVKRNAKMGVHAIPTGGHFKGAPMPYFLRLTNDGIGMHAGPIPKPGHRASHGCIRMPKEFAPILYNHVDLGTVVTIKGNGPTYASYLAKQRRSTPKPATAAITRTTPPQTPTADATPPLAATGNDAGPRSASASDRTAATPRAAALNPPLAATATPRPPESSAAAAPGNTLTGGSAPSWNPMAGFATPSVGIPGVPAYPPTHGVTSFSPMGSEVTTAPTATTSAGPSVFPATTAPDVSEATSSSTDDSSRAPTPVAAPPAPETTRRSAFASVEKTTDASVSPATTTGQKQSPPDPVAPPTETAEGTKQRQDLDP